MHQPPPETIKDINFSLLYEPEKEYVFSLLQKHEITLCCITPAGSLKVFNTAPEQVADFRHELHRNLPTYSPSQEGLLIKACQGVGRCSATRNDPIPIGRRLVKLNLSKPLPHKIKIGISGCHHCCMQSYVRDIGIVAAGKGWNVLFGGNSGSKPRIGDTVARGIRENEVVDLVTSLLEYYLKNAKNKQRTSAFVENVSIEQIKAAL